MAGQPDEPVAQVPLLDEHENDEDDHEARARHGVEELRHAHEANGLVLDGDGNGHGSRFGSSCFWSSLMTSLAVDSTSFRAPGFLTPRRSAIFCLRFLRYSGQLVAKPDDLLGHDVADPPRTKDTRMTTRTTDTT